VVQLEVVMSGGFSEYHLIDTAGYQMEGNDASMGRKRPLWLV